MPNVASVLKAEIIRVARKELRSETTSLHKAMTAHRTAIAAMRKRLETLERQLKAARKSGAKAASQAEENETGTSLRFRAEGLKKHRARLGLSAADAAKIVGVSALSIYNWENGKTRPRAAQLEAIAKLRTMGKRQAFSRLEELGG